MMAMFILSLRFCARRTAGAAATLDAPAIMLTDAAGNVATRAGADDLREAAEVAAYFSEAREHASHHDPGSSSLPVCRQHYRPHRLVHQGREKNLRYVNSSL